MDLLLYKNSIQGGIHMAQNDPIVNVQAKLDQAKSKQNINADLKTLQKQT